MKIEILGSCPTCEMLFYSSVLYAVEKAGLKHKAQIEMVKDINYFIKLGILITPALVVDGEVLCSGKLLTPDEILELFRAKGLY